MHCDNESSSTATCPDIVKEKGSPNGEFGRRSTLISEYQNGHNDMNNCFAANFHLRFKYPHFQRILCNRTYFASFSCASPSQYRYNSVNVDHSVQPEVEHAKAIFVAANTYCMSGFSHVRKNSSCLHLISLNQSMISAFGKQTYTEVCKEHNLSPFILPNTSYFDDLIHATSFIHYFSKIVVVTMVNLQNMCTYYYYTAVFVISAQDVPLEKKEDRMNEIYNAPTQSRLFANKIC